MNKKMLSGLMLAPMVLLAAMTAHAQSAYFQAVTNLNPVGYWPMHEMGPAAPGDIETNYGSLGVLANGYYADWATNRPVIIRQVPGALAGSANAAVQFNTNIAANASGPYYLLVPRTLPATTLQPPFTIETWFNPQNANFGDLISEAGTPVNSNNNGRAGFRLIWAGNFAVWIGGSSVFNSVSYPNGQWYHVAVTVDVNSNCVLYVDGSQAGTKAVPITWDPSLPLTIGSGLWGANNNSTGPSRPVDGAIDEVAIYTNALSSDRILAHYNSGIDPTNNGDYKTNVLADNPAIYFRMDAPPYAPPPVNTWPVLTNYGTVAINGVYNPGTMPGAVAGPNAVNLGSNAMPGNGLSSFADAGNNPAFNPPTNNASFSYIIWFKGNPADDRAYQSLISANDGSWRCSINGSGKIQAHGEGGDVVSPLIYNDGNWHQAVLTCVETNTTLLTPNTNILYVDGVQVGMTTGAGFNNPAGFAGPDVLIGDETGLTNSPNGSGRSFAGNLCEAAFFNYALTPGQVQSLYNVAGVPPIITQQPVSATVNQNTAFTNTIVAGGSQPLFYRWYKDNVALGNQTNASLILNPVQGTDAGNYYVVVTNSVNAVTSTVVSLTVNTFPVITDSTPVTYTNPFALYAGVSPTFSVAAIGAVPIFYQWYTNGVAVGGATNTSFTFTNAQNSFTNYCVVSNSVSTATNFWAATVIPTNGLPAYPVSVLALNPFGYWRLNEADDQAGDGNPGAICHDYASGNDGIYTNAYLGQQGYNPTADPTDTSCYFGYFSNPNSDANSIQGVDFSTPNGSNAEFTVEAWVNPQYQPTTTGGIAAKGYFNQEEFTLDCGAPTNSFRFEVRSAAGTAYNANSIISTANPSQLNHWYHLVGVCDETNGKVSLYINGALAGSATIPTASGITNSSTTPMWIGARSQNATIGNDQQFLGYVNDVAVFKHALTASQVASEYAIGGNVSPFFIQTPPTNVTLVANGTLTLPAIAEGTPTMNYWWSDVNGGTNVATGSTNGAVLNASLTVSNVPAGWNGDQLELSVSNAFGGTNFYVSLSVSSAPVITTNLPPQLTLMSGRYYTYSIGVIGTPPLSYQWYNGSSPIPGQTGSTYTLTAGNPGTSNYSVVVTNLNGSATSAVSIVTVVASYQSQILSNNPVAYWPLNEGPDNGAGNDGVIATDLANGHNGVYSNVVLGVAGYANDPDTAAQFGTYATPSFAQELDLSGNGIPNIDFAQPSGNNAEFSVEVWCNATAGQTLNDRIVDKGHFFGEQFALDLGTTSPSTAFRFTLRNAAGTSYDARSSVVPDGKWHHLVGVCDEANGAVMLYVDGMLTASNNFNGGPAPGSGLYSDSELVTIGNADTSQTGLGTYTAQFVGAIGDVAIYNYVMSASQVQADYQVVTAGNISINTNPTNIVFSISGNQLTLTWPADHIGWELQTQTNSLSVGISTNWVNVSSSTTTNQMTIPMNPTNGSVFYRLVYPAL